MYVIRLEKLTHYKWRKGLPVYLTVGLFKSKKAARSYMDKWPGSSYRQTVMKVWETKEVTKL